MAGQAADLFGDTAALTWRDYFPGLALTGIVALASANVARGTGLPLTLLALAAGLALGCIGKSAALQPGLDLVARSLLRWAIVLAGLQVTFTQITALGMPVLAATIAVASVAMVTAIAFSRLTGQGLWYGVLAGGAVAICGASAAFVIALTLGQERISQRQLATVLAVVAMLSTAAMLGYPITAHLMGLGNEAAGFVLGSSIHDVAQSLAAGYSYSPGAGEVATVVKLGRVALLAPLVVLLAALLPRHDRLVRPPPVPWYLGGFFAAVGFNSCGLVPALAGVAASSLATVFLTMAIAAMAIRTSLGSLILSGWRPVVVVLAATGASFLAAHGAAQLVF